MKSSLLKTTIGTLTAMLCASATAQTTVSTYDDLAEGNLGTEFSYNGITYSDLNGRAGVFPDGDTFDASYPGSLFLIEDATFFHNDFPGWGSPNNVLTFGSAFVPGPNLSLGGFVHMHLALDEPADFMSMAMAFYENGPWIGIEYILEGYSNGQIVATDSYTISGEDPNGRDRIGLTTMTIEGAAFDSVVMKAMYQGEFSAPRLLIDDLTVRTIPAPATGLALLGMGAFARRRR